MRRSLSGELADALLGGEGRRRITSTRPQSVFMLAGLGGLQHVLVAVLGDVPGQLGEPERFGVFGLAGPTAVVGGPAAAPRCCWLESNFSGITRRPQGLGSPW